MDKNRLVNSFFLIAGYSVNKLFVIYRYMKC